MGRGQREDLKITFKQSPAVNVRFTAHALSDLDTARRWYEGRSPGLETYFDDDVEYAVGCIIRQPFIWPILTNSRQNEDIRLITLEKFPYMLVYRLDVDDSVMVLAVPHLHQRPGRWIRRLKDK